MNKQTLLLLTALAAIPSSLTAATIVNVDFEDAGTPMGNLVDFSSSHNPAGFPNTHGVSSSNGLLMDGNTMVANDTGLAMDGTEINFSVDGRYSGSGRTGGAGFLFGWTQATGAIDPYNAGTNTTVTVGVTNAGTAGTYILSVGGGINSHGSSGFGSTTILTANLNDWYRLSGTMLFDGSTGTFTFNDIEFSHLGATGLDAPSLLLSGTNQTFTDAANWNASTQGRVTALANKDRGFKFTDNYLVTAIPEPAAAMFVCLGSLLLLRRRRA